MTRFFAHANYDFIGVRKYAYAITAAIILPGLLFLAVRGLNYSIEFTGGTLLQIRAKTAVNVGAVRSALDGQGIHGAEIQQFGTATEYTIRRNGQSPRVEVRDALQAHKDLLRIYSDTDIHNVTAYLESLK